MITHIKDTYLFLNLYNSSSLLNQVAENYDSDVLSDDYKNFDELAKVHFLIYCNRNGLKNLIHSISANLNKHSLQQTLTNKGHIKGNVDWNITFRQRLTTGFNDKSIFVTKPTFNEFNNIPNQLFKFLLLKVLDFISDVRNLLNGDASFLGLETNELEILIRRLLKYSKVKDINTLKSIDKKMVNYTMRLRNKDYRKLSELGRLYIEIFIKKKELALFDIFKEQLLIPSTNDKIFELVVFFEVINTLKTTIQNTDSEMKFSLIRQKQKNCISFKINHSKLIHVYYQHVPNNMAKYNWYKYLLNSYNINNPKTRQPDIIVELENTAANTKFYKIIEVKYSKQRSYIGEGIHDVLSYQSDFKEHLLPNRPNILLVMWEAISERPLHENQLPIWLTDWRNLKSSLQEFLKD